MLEAILESVRSRLGEVTAAAADLERDARARPPARDLAKALRAPGLSIIAEIKRGSPSRGAIAPGLDPASMAAAYERGGAAAVSVLTERDHFGGGPADLRAAAEAVSLPILRKDFVIHPAQVWESRVMGADAVLLIAAVLDDDLLIGLIETCRTAGLGALVEIHTEEEADRVIAAGAGIVGVNNRDLVTFEVDLGTAERLRSRLGEDVVAVAESGVHDAAGAGRMAAAGYDAVLVGEAAVRADTPQAFIAALQEAG